MLFLPVPPNSDLFLKIPLTGSVQSCRVPKKKRVIHKKSFWGEFFTVNKSEQNFKATEVQNRTKHRIIWVERDHSRAPSPTPLPSRLCRTMSRWGLEHLKEWLKSTQSPSVSLAPSDFQE